MAVRKLLFVDTNILLDFYRARTEAGLKLLNHLDKISPDIIVTYQLEMEFKKNRQAAIKDGMKELQAPVAMQRPGLFSDAKAVRAIENNQKVINRHVAALRARLIKALQDPGKYDPVFKVCQRLFHKNDVLALSRTDPVRHVIRRKALKRFLFGCPPRKSTDTSIGDAFNWEWMIGCAKAQNAELVILSRDSDYGGIFDNTAYINDHLKQEFSERVSKKRNILLYHRLSDALKHFKVTVTEAEVKEEELISKPPSGPEGPTAEDFNRYVDRIFGIGGKIGNQRLRDLLGPSK